MRRELKKRGVKKLKVVYSKEKPTRPIEICPSAADKTVSVLPELRISVRETGYSRSLAFVPSVAGLIIAGEVFKDLAGRQQKA